VVGGTKILYLLISNIDLVLEFKNLWAPHHVGLFRTCFQKIVLKNFHYAKQFFQNIIFSLSLSHSHLSLLSSLIGSRWFCGCSGGFGRCCRVLIVKKLVIIIINHRKLCGFWLENMCQTDSWFSKLLEKCS
jgi:hypothetical protein